MRPVDLVLSRLDGVRRGGAGWVALCPAHDDHNPSLSVAEGADGRALVHCHRQCDIDVVLAHIGVAKAELFPEGSRERRRARVWKGVIPLRPDNRPALECMGDPVVPAMLGEVARVAAGSGTTTETLVDALLAVGDACGAETGALEAAIARGLAEGRR